MYNVRPRCGQTITHHYMPSARLLYPHERVGPCPLDKLYPCSHTTINYLKNVPLVSYYYNAMWSNGSVYMKRVMLVTRFHKQWFYLPWWPFINRSKHMPERFKYTMLDRVATKLSHSITCPLHDCFTHTSGLAHAHSINYTLAHTPQFNIWKTYRSCHIIIMQCGLTV